MAYGNTVTIVGNVTRDPEMRFTPSGSAVANFAVAWNKPSRNAAQGAEREACFFDIVCWDTLAENVNTTITKGTRVCVTGRLDQRSWEAQDGSRRSKIEIVADDVAPSLRWASAEISRNSRDDSYGGGGGGGYSQAPTYSAPSAATPEQTGGPAPAAPANPTNFDGEPF